MQRIHDNNDSHLNLFKLKRLIDSGISSIPVDKKHKNAVLVIGDTGVGKTTILSFLAKRKLYVKIHGLNTILDADEADGLRIGHDRFSETRVPQKIIIDRLVFFDCSGFKDNRGEQYEISNSFFVKRLFDIYSNIKILLIVDEVSISESRADKLPKLVRNLLKSFENLSDIQDGVILLINKAKPQFDQQKYQEQLLKMAKLKGQEGPLFNKEEKEFIEYLVDKKRVCLFKQARQEDQGKVLDVKEENLLNLVKDASYVKTKKIKNIISESSKLSIRDFLDRLSQDAQEKIQKFSRNIVANITMHSKASEKSSLKAAEYTKQELLNFLKKIQGCQNDKILQTIQELTSVDLTSFEEDISAVLFFKDIYNKTEFYFKIVRGNLKNEITSVVLKIDSQIAILQEEKRKMEEIQRRFNEKNAQNEKLRQQMQKYKIQNEEYCDKITEITKNYNHQANIFQNSINIKDAQLKELNKMMESLKIEKQENAQQIEMLNIENISLKNQLNFVQEELSKLEELSKKSEQSKLSISSKASKYPDVICPHFKNGGKCVHCIKTWKAEQKQKKKQQMELN